MLLPHILENGPGNWPDADKYMANWQYANIMASQNLLRDAGFDDWTGDASFAAVINAQSLTHPWYVEIGGTSAPTANIAQSTTTRKAPSTNSLKVSLTVAGDETSYVRICQNSILPLTRVGSAYTLVFGAHVHTNQASKVRLSCTDGTSTNYSSYHSGNSGYEKLTGQIQLVYSTVNTLTVKAEILGDFTGDVYLDNFFAYLVPDAIPTAARDALDYRPALFDIPSMFFNTSALLSYRRPVLKFISVTAVDVENNTQTANETKIIFPDGDVRAVVENTGSTHVNRRFTITATAALSGVKDSGLRNGLSEATNTWYAIYAVKTKDDRTSFVLVGDTVLPLQANWATLNTSYGTGCWVYLGMIRNGDNDASTGDILTFVQTGNKTILRNTLGGHPASGLLLVSATATTATYTYAAGTGTTDIPTHCPMAFYSGYIAAGATTRFDIYDAGAARRYFAVATNSLIAMSALWMCASEGIRLSNSAGASIGYYVDLRGWVDSLLGVGANPSL